jgi:hypothetical protein
MSTTLRRSVWFGRFVLVAATLLLGGIAAKYISDPVGAVADHGITLASADALTSMRVAGGLFLAIAIVLVACLVSERRLLIGLAVLATVAVVILAVRLLGLGLDGPAPFTLEVLKPEVALVLFSGLALLLERKRRAARECERDATRAEPSA